MYTVTRFVLLQKVVFAIVLLLPTTLGFAAPILLDFSTPTNRTYSAPLKPMDEKLATNNKAVAPSSNQLEETIALQAKNNGLSPNFIKAVIDVESNFNHVALSPKGAIGLMQVMPETAARYGKYNLYNSTENITVGTKHLAYLMSRYKNVPYALAAYNAGEGNVDKYQGIPPFAETQSYVLKVLKAYNQRLDRALLSAKPGKSSDSNIKPLKVKETNTKLSNNAKPSPKVILLSL